MTINEKQKEPTSYGCSNGIQLELTPFLQARVELGTKIVTPEEPIRKITKNYFRVKSQSGRGWYNVRKLPERDVWICDCQNFMQRLVKKDDKRCKHIISAQTLRNSIEQELRTEKLGVSIVCLRCKSPKINKCGFRTVQNQIKRQIFLCRQCRHRFALRESGFASMRFSPQIVIESLNLFMSGMSYRNIAKHIKAVHNESVSHVAVMGWMIKYMGIIKDYVDSFMPKLSDVWSMDEMMVNVKKTSPIKSKGLYDWLWTIIDPKTKFVIATEVSKKREISDARKIVAKGKEVSKPNYVITDSLHSYRDAIRKELSCRKTAHIMTKSLRDGFQNRPIERYHNEIREKLKARRGLGNDESTKRFADFYAIYHNFVRPHSGLPGNITPAEASGIDLNLGNDKIKDLITKSVESKVNFAVQLGKRIKEVDTVNEKDCIKVIPKGWMERQSWREINDILRFNGFNWISNGKDGCWIKMIEGALK